MQLPIAIRAREEISPAVLRTELPTLVWDTCTDLQQVAVWLSVRWLLALNGNQPAVLTGPEIARVAGVALDVTQRCLALPQPDRPAPRSLVALGLLDVETKRGRWGDRHAPREYTIPARIETDNLRATQAWLARSGTVRQNAPLDSRQLGFDLHGLAAAPDANTSAASLVLTQDVPEELLRTSLPTIVRALAPSSTHVMLWLAIRRLIALSGRASVAVSTKDVAALAKVSLPTARKYLPNPSHPDVAPNGAPITLDACRLIEVRGWVPDPRQPKLRIPICAIPAALEAQNVAATRRYIDGGFASSIHTSRGTVKDHDHGDAGGVKNHDQVPDRDPSTDRDRDLSIDRRLSASQCSSQLSTGEGGEAAPDRDLSPSVDQRDRDFSTSVGASALQCDDSALGMMKDHDHTRDRDLSTDRDRDVASDKGSPASQCVEQEIIGVKNHDHGVGGRRKGDIPSHKKGLSDEATLPHSHTSGTSIPPAPPGEPALSAHPYQLWALAHGACSDLDRHQLHLFAGSVDCLPVAAESGASTPRVQGYGWYWVGRAILEPAYAEGGARSVAVVRSVLARWKSTGQWGAGLTQPEAGAGAQPRDRRSAGDNLEPPAASAAVAAASARNTSPALPNTRVPRPTFARRPRGSAPAEGFQ